MRCLVCQHSVQFACTQTFSGQTPLPPCYNAPMPSERDKERAWWRFDTRDLFMLTALVAVLIVVTLTIQRMWQPPYITGLVSVLPIADAVIGTLAKQFWGGILGALAGGVLGIAALLVAFYVHPVHFFG